MQKRDSVVKPWHIQYLTKCCFRQIWLDAILQNQHGCECGTLICNILSLSMFRCMASNVRISGLALSSGHDDNNYFALVMPVHTKSEMVGKFYFKCMGIYFLSRKQLSIKTV